MKTFSTILFLADTFILIGLVWLFLHLSARRRLKARDRFKLH